MVEWWIVRGQRAVVISTERFHDSANAVYTLSQHDVSLPD